MRADGPSRRVEHKDATPEQRGSTRQQRHLRVRARAALRGLKSIGAANAQGSTTCQTWWALPRPGGGSKPYYCETRGRSRGQQPRELRRGQFSRDAERQLMAAGVSIVDRPRPGRPGHNRRGPRCPPNVYLEADADRRELRNPPRLRIVDSTIDDGVGRQQLLRITESASRRARASAVRHIPPQSEVGEGEHVGNFRS